MSLSLIIGLCFLITLIWVALTTAKNHIKVFSILATTLIALFLGYAIGFGWAGLVNYDQYVWRFSQYSGYIRGLAERQQIAELTNTVILFDSKFNPRKDPHDLQDAIFQIFKLGKYYVDTNAVTSTQASNVAHP
jgi:hypothetical protein